MTKEDDEWYINKLKDIKKVNNEWLQINQRIKNFTEECMNEGRRGLYAVGVV